MMTNTNMDTHPLNDFEQNVKDHIRRIKKAIAHWY
jgi:hypothetical protein